jgi:hypothetical protein
MKHLVMMTSLALVALPTKAPAECLVSGAGLADTYGEILDPHGEVIYAANGQLGFSGRVAIGDAAAGFFTYFSTGNSPAMNFFPDDPLPTHGRANLAIHEDGAFCDGTSFSFSATNDVVHITQGVHQVDLTEEVVSGSEGGDLRIERTYSDGYQIIFLAQLRSGHLKVH